MQTHEKGAIVLLHPVCAALRKARAHKQGMSLHPALLTHGLGEQLVLEVFSFILLPERV
jgi:hypothetical protein